MSIPTKPVEGQKTGTSGLRKKVWIPPPPFLFRSQKFVFFLPSDYGFSGQGFPRRKLSCQLDSGSFYVWKKTFIVIIDDRLEVFELFHIFIHLHHWIKSISIEFH